MKFKIKWRCPCCSLLFDAELTILNPCDCLNDATMGTANFASVEIRKGDKTITQLFNPDGSSMVEEE